MQTDTSSRPAPLVMNINDAAASLALSRDSIYRLIKRGDLKPVRIGRRQSIPVEQIQALVAGVAI